MLVRVGALFPKKKKKIEIDKTVLDLITKAKTIWEGAKAENNSVESVAVSGGAKAAKSSHLISAPEFA